jgi:bacteriocin biosynthesis cyclodehydratase domain-containing protein
VLLLGAGRLGSRIAGNLVMTGFRRLTLLDASTVSSDDRMASPLLLHAKPGTARVDVLASALRELAPDASVRSVTETDVRTLERELAAHDLAIMAADRFDPRLLDDVNRLAVRLEKRWSMSLVSGWNLRVGPTFFPGQSGCLICFQRETGETWVRESAPEGPAAATEPSGPPESGFPSLVWPPHADVAAGLLATDMLHAAGIMPRRIEPGTGLTLGRQLVFDLKSGHAFWQTVPRRPDCPVCGTGSSQTREY